MRPSEKNVKLPGMEHEYCSFCGDDNVALVVMGNSAASCGYCSNEIVMCQCCYSLVVSKGNELIGEGKLQWRES